MNTPGSRGRTALRLGAIGIAVLGALYAGGVYVDNAIRKGVERFTKNLADSLAALRFNTLESVPRRAFVVYGEDTVGTIHAGGELSSGKSAQSLVLLGRWAETDRARLVRRWPTLSGLVQVSPDSSSLVVQIQERARSDAARVRGYLLLAPDSRWVTLH